MGKVKAILAIVALFLTVACSVGSDIDSVADEYYTITSHTGLEQDATNEEFALNLIQSEIELADLSAKLGNPESERGKHLKDMIEYTRDMCLELADYIVSGGSDSKANSAYKEAIVNLNEAERLFKEASE